MLPCSISSTFCLTLIPQDDVINAFLQATSALGSFCNSSLMLAKTVMEKTWRVMSAGSWLCSDYFAYNSYTSRCCYLATTKVALPVFLVPIISVLASPSQPGVWSCFPQHFGCPPSSFEASGSQPACSYIFYKSFSNQTKHRSWLESFCCNFWSHNSLEEIRWRQLRIDL